jgi:hypothetical protein
MKYQIGDKIIVLHSDEAGEVIDIINDKMVMIEVKGVKFPAYMDQIDFPYYKMFSGKTVVPEKKKPKQFIDNVRAERKPSASKVADGVWLTFIPVFDTDEYGDEVVTNFKIYLNNHTHDGYKFTYAAEYFGEKEFELKNECYSFNDFYLHDIPFADLSDSPRFEFTFSLITPQKGKEDSYTVQHKIRPKTIFAKIEELKGRGDATIPHLLFKTFPDKSSSPEVELSEGVKNLAKIYDAKRVRENLEPAKAVIDLHIELLTSNWQQMSNFEILSLQMKTFEKYFDLAVAHHQPTLVVIHGVGSGRLRDEVHEFLKLRREVKYFINQYNPKYGYGATEIAFN